MNANKYLIPTALLASFALTATPVLAQHRGGGHSGGGGQRNGGQNNGGQDNGASRGGSRGPSTRSAEPRSSPSPRSYAPRSYESRSAAPRSAAPRSYESRSIAPRSGVSAPRGVYGGRNYGYGSYSRSGSAVRIAPRGLGSRGGYSSPRVIGPRGYGSRGVIGSSGRFYRPYYSFRPRVSLGFGLWVGYPVAYPRYYDYDYDYGYPAYGYPYADAYAYPPPAYSTYGGYPPAEYDSYPAPSNGGYPPPSYGGYQAPSNGAYPPPASYPNQPQASVGVQQPEQTASGVSFEITPATAQIFVDGALVGTASMFDPSSQPLPLTPGRHHVEVRAPGYQTMEFDAEVSPGQVIPYQGAMQRGR